MNARSLFTVLLLLVFPLFLHLAIPASGQVSISPDNSPPGTSAGLDVNFSDRGFLPPRMSFDQRNAIPNPAEGLIIYCTNCGLDGTGLICIYTSGEWTAVSPCVTEPPASGSHIPLACGITWTWYPVPGAAGYKWNSVNSFQGALDMGTDTSKTETGLQCGIVTFTRYIWTYSDCGISVPETLSLAYNCPPCGQPFTDCRDDKTYNTVLIGTQCWMSQNLNVGTRINSGTTQNNNGVIEKYCYVDNEAYCTTYGGLYNWYEFMNYTSSSDSNPSERQGICPAGFHIPSDAEWCQLELYLDATVVCDNTDLRGTDAGGKMKEAGYTHWASPNTGGNNASGFTALPGGQFYIFSSTFNEMSLKAFFWTATQYPGEYWFYSYKRWLAHTSQKVGRGIDLKTMMFSGRCLRD